MYIFPLALHTIINEQRFGGNKSGDTAAKRTKTISGLSPPPKSQMAQYGLRFAAIKSPVPPKPLL